MPSGIVHRRNWGLGWFFSIPIGIFLFTNVNTFIGIGEILGYALGSYIDPDLDQMGISNSEGRMVKIPIIGIPLFGLSCMYGAVARRHHRSFLTHFPGVSTIIRLIFMFWWVYLFYYFGWIVYEQWHFSIFIGVFIGLSFSDFVHWMADSLPKGKRKRHKRRNY